MFLLALSWRAFSADKPIDNDDVRPRSVCAMISRISSFDEGNGDAQGEPPADPAALFSLLSADEAVGKKGELKRGVEGPAGVSARGPALLLSP
jgi:hypothetical protein